MSQKGKKKSVMTVATLIRRSAEYRAWREKQLRQYEYRCWVTGKRAKDLHVHHSNIGFFIILSKVMKLYRVSYNKPVEHIPVDVLNGIQRLFWMEHKNARGVPLLKSLHKEFHKRYGASGNSLKQLQDFKLDYLGSARDTNGK